MFLTDLVPHPDTVKVASAAHSILVSTGTGPISSLNSNGELT